MMGIYRLLLACCVVVAHLTEGVSGLSHAGIFAVFGFYVLSGYVITRALNDFYDFAFVPFWSNRILRLYPLYFIVLGLGIALVLGTGRAHEFFPAAWNANPGRSDWIGVITVFPMGFRPMAWSFRPVPSIWSVGVEILNYALLYMAVARRKPAALFALVAAGVYHAYSLWRGDDWSFRYFPFHAAVLPFALGALIYFIRRSRPMVISPRVAMLMCAPAAANFVLAGLFGGAQSTSMFDVLFYLNLLFQCLAVAALASIGASFASRGDKVLGDLSYPLFLCHWLVGYVVSLMLFSGQSRGIALMVATLAVSLGVAYGLSRVQDMLIEPLRSAIRSNATNRRRVPEDAASIVA
jgi:peptidoglycan/LPS O-acetylase OafA/YrhL